MILRTQKNSYYLESAKSMDAVPTSGTDLNNTYLFQSLNSLHLTASGWTVFKGLLMMFCKHYPHAELGPSQGTLNSVYFANGVWI